MKNLDQIRPEDRQGRLPGTALRLSAGLLLMGFIVFVVMGVLHPGGPANDHETIFRTYAASEGWTSIHLGQFAGMALIVAGLLVLYFTVDLGSGGAVWAGRLGAICAGISLGLYGVLQAVDGVALKQAVVAWVSAPPFEADARFAGAEAIRWMEWGARSHHTLMLGLALVLLGSAIGLAARLPKPLGYLMALSGVAYIVQGWVLGFEGFSETNTLAILAAYVLMLAWILWLLLIAMRSTDSPKVNTQ